MRVRRLSLLPSLPFPQALVTRATGGILQVHLQEILRNPVIREPAKYRIVHGYLSSFE